MSATVKTPRRKSSIVRRKGRPVEAESSVGAVAIVLATKALLQKVPASRLRRSDVAKAVGIDPALIRYYFTDLEGLFLATTEHMLAELRERLAASYMVRGTFRKRLRERVRTYLEYFRENPNFHSLVYEHVLNGKGPASSRMRRNMLQPSIRELDELVRSGVVSGEIHQVDPRFVHTATIAMTEFFFSGRVVFDELFGGAERSPLSLEDDYCDFVTEVIVGTSARASKAQRAATPARPRSRT